MDEKPARVVITLRAPADLKARLDVYAERLGISVNAVALTLLDTALRAAEKEVR